MLPRLLLYMFFGCIMSQYIQNQWNTESVEAFYLHEKWAYVYLLYIGEVFPNLAQMWFCHRDLTAIEFCPRPFVSVSQVSKTCQFPSSPKGRHVIPIGNWLEIMRGRVWKDLWKDGKQFKISIWLSIRPCITVSKLFGPDEKCEFQSILLSFKRELVLSPLFWGGDRGFYCAYTKCLGVEQVSGASKHEV